jgi:hypothetical protein
LIPGGFAPQAGLEEFQTDTLRSSLVLSDRWSVQSVTSHGVEPGLHLGADAAPGTRLDESSQYVRIATHYAFDGLNLPAGLFAKFTNLHHDDRLKFGSDRLTDVGYDASLRYDEGGDNTFSASLAYLYEKRKTDRMFDTGRRSQKMGILRFDANWTWQKTFSLSTAAFSTGATRDPTLFDNSIGTEPRSSGVMILAEVFPHGDTSSRERPWTRLRLGLQYTDYFQFNGSPNNDAQSSQDHDFFLAFVRMPF